MLDYSKNPLRQINNIRRETIREKTNWEKEFDILSSSLGLDGEQMDELRDFFRKQLIKLLKKGDLL